MVGLPGPTNRRVRNGGPKTAPLLIGPALLMVVIVRWRVIRRSLLIVSAVAIATLAGVLVVWLVPAATGKIEQPLLLFLGRQTAKQIGYADRLSSLGEMIPALVGTLLGTVILMGLVAAAWGAIKGQLQAAPILGCTVVGAIGAMALTLGIADHMVRYFTPVVPFLALGAAPGLVWLSSKLPMPAVVVAST